MWIREGSIGFSNSPSSLVQQRKLRPKARRPPSLKEDTLGTRGTYLEVKSSGVLGLPPDDGCDPSDEQQQQHSHCCEHGVSREHLAGPLGQDQAQDYQQENCKGQGGEQAGLQKPKTPGPWVTASPPMLPTSGRATVSPRLLLNCSKHTAFSMLSIPEYSQREVPLLTKQGGTSIDNVARFQSGGGTGREPQSL